MLLGLCIFCLLSCFRDVCQITWPKTRQPFNKKEIPASGKFTISRCSPAVFSKIPAASMTNILITACAQKKLKALLTVVHAHNCLINYLGFTRNITECLTITGNYSTTPFTMNLGVIRKMLTQIIYNDAHAHVSNLCKMD